MRQPVLRSVYNKQPTAKLLPMIFISQPSKARSERIRNSENKVGLPFSILFFFSKGREIFDQRSAEIERNFRRFKFSWLLLVILTLVPTGDGVSVFVLCFHLFMMIIFLKRLLNSTFPTSIVSSNQSARNVQLHSTETNKYESKSGEVSENDPSRLKLLFQAPAETWFLEQKENAR